MANTKKPVRRTRKPATTPLTKEALAKKKVDELLDGVKLTKADKEVVIDRLDVVTKDKSVDYLKKQIAGLTEQNTKLTDDYKKLLNDYKQKGGGDDNELKKGVEKLFFELDGVFTGAKFGKPFEEAKIRPLLNKFMATFPFLVESLKKKNTITQVARK